MTRTPISGSGHFELCGGPEENLVAPLAVVGRVCRAKHVRTFPDHRNENLSKHSMLHVVLSHDDTNLWVHVFVKTTSWRWFEEARAFVSQLAKTKAKCAPRVLACANGRTFAGPPCCCGLRWSGSFQFGCRHNLPPISAFRIQKTNSLSLL